MAKPEWGAERVCQSCGTKFYNFHRDPILCPSCGATYQPDDVLKPRRSRVEPKGRAAVKPAPIEEDEEIEAEEEDEDLLLDEEEDEEDIEAEDALIEPDDEDEEADEVKGGKAPREPLLPDEDLEDAEVLDEELDEDLEDADDLDEEIEDLEEDDEDK